MAISGPFRAWSVPPPPISMLFQTPRATLTDVMDKPGEHQHTFGLSSCNLKYVRALQQGERCWQLFGLQEHGLWNKEPTSDDESTSRLSSQGYANQDEKGSEFEWSI